MNFSSDKIRNIVLVGHGSCGKTSIAEAMLYLSGSSSRLGSVQEKTSTLDFEPEERKRGGSIATSLSFCVHKEHKVNILDTPGDQNFIYDSFNAMRGADAAVIVVGASDGVEVQTQRVYSEAKKLGLPVVFFLNKMDRDRADYERCLLEIEDSFGVKPAPLQLPIGSNSEFKGLVSLLQKKALIYSNDGKFEKTEIPDELRDEFESHYERLIECVAETDEDLLEIYLETFELSEKQIRTGFQKALKVGKIAPVLYGSAIKTVGVEALLDLSTWAFPSPLERDSITMVNGDELSEVSLSEDGEFHSQVIHTIVDEFSGKTSIIRIFTGMPPSDNSVYNPSKGRSERLGSLFSLKGRERISLPQVLVGDIVAASKLKGVSTGDTLNGRKGPLQFEKVNYPSPMMSYIVRPSSKNASSKLKDGLDRILDEDPTLSLSNDELTGNIVIHGMGQAHLDMAIERMSRKYKVDVSTDLPPVAYRETLKKAVNNIEGRHKKQTGGAGQFGVCFVHIRPSERGSGFLFNNKIVGGSIPKTLIPSVEKGMRIKMNNGYLAGYPIVDIEVDLYDGKYHPVDSKDIAFQMAGSKALKTAFEEGGIALLEPVYEMEIIIPEEYMGDIMGDLSSRRGRIVGSEMRGKNAIVQARCPLAEVRRYAPDLSSMSSGKGVFTMMFSDYEPVPQNLIHGIVSASPFRKNMGEE